jgi:hypothetical protein
MYDNNDYEGDDDNDDDDDDDVYYDMMMMMMMINDYHLVDYMRHEILIESEFFINCD